MIFFLVDITIFEMFCLVKNDVTQHQNKLKLNQDIFPRPTPWLVFFRAWKSYFWREHTYRFTYFPSQIDLHQYAIDVEDDMIVLRDRFGEENLYAPCLRLTWQLWGLFMLESVLYGLLFRFWRWRWAEEKIEGLARKKTRRIEEEDED